MTEKAPNWCAISGAVAIVAASVIAAPSASAPRTDAGSPPISPAIGRAQSRIPTTAAKLSCQPTSELARGSIASVVPAASRSAYQRERGREARPATIPAAPITPARWIEAPAPATGT